VPIWQIHECVLELENPPQRCQQLVCCSRGHIAITAQVWLRIVVQSPSIGWRPQKKLSALTPWGMPPGIPRFFLCRSGAKTCASEAKVPRHKNKPIPHRNCISDRQLSLAPLQKSASPAHKAKHFAERVIPGSSTNPNQVVLRPGRINQLHP